MVVRAWRGFWKRSGRAILPGRFFWFREVIFRTIEMMPVDGI
jgi:hypothetical protein